jgi:hypothetical protein
MTSLKTTSLNTTSLKTKSIIHKSLTVSCGLLIASLALTGNALAANAPVAKTAHARPVTHFVRRAPARHPDLGQIFGSFFGIPFAAGVAGGSYVVGSQDTGGYDTIIDSPSPAVEVDNSESQAAIDASGQAIQQMDQDLQALDQSIAASEAQNDAANAAALQTEINANN